MGLSEFDIITDKLIGVTEYLYLHIMGEPLLHPELGAFISLAKEKGFKCAVTTNGTLLDKAGGILISHGAYKVNISIHSFEDGSCEEYLSYINKCMDFADRASDAGILTVLRLWNRGYDGGRNIDTVSLLRQRFPYEWIEGERGARLRHKLHLEYGERFDWPDMSIEPIGDRVFCYGLGDHFGILSDGRVVPCCLDKNGDITLGNIFNESLESILMGDRAAHVKQGFQRKCAVEELCKRCGYARRFKL
jgi:radical SAM protein with 4Fe4S-binding SPASM domain